MKHFVCVLPFVLWSFSSLFADDVAFSEDSLKAPITYPGSPIPNKYLASSGKTYLYDTHCTGIGANGKFSKGSFEVLKLHRRIRREVNTKPIPDVWKYYCDENVEYKVTCGNGLSYKGQLQWEKYRWKCQYGCSHVNTSWQNVPLSDYNATTGKFAQSGKCKDVNKVPISQIFNLWNNRKVALPKNPGGKNKLARPVIFIPGHNATMSSFGVIPKGKEVATNSDFVAGKVSGYEENSLPDVMARDQKLDISRKGINSNGLYFFTAPYRKSGNTYKQVLPQWQNNKPASSISFSLYQHIEKVLNAHYGNKWKSDSTLQVDLVAHSQGGLVVREMLRGLRSAPSRYPKGLSNAANHIRRLVSVNTPHFGSELGDDYKNIQNSKPAVAAFIREIGDQKNREKKGQKVYTARTLLSADVKKDLVKYFKEGGTDTFNEILSFAGVDNTLAKKTSFFVSPLEYITTGLLGTATDVSVTLQGSYVGDFQLKTHYKYLRGLKTKNVYQTIDFLKPLRDTLWNWHVDGSHLATHSDFIQKLTKEGYPKRPDGKNIELLPMYSSDVRGIRDYFLGQLAIGSKKLCANSDDVGESSCFVVTAYLNSLLYKSQGVKLENFKELQKWLNFYNNLMEEWLGSSDLLVTRYSQQFTDKKMSLGAKYQKEFLRPRTYSIYLSQVPKKYPYNVVPHGDVLNYGSVDNGDYGIHLKSVEFEGAPRKGLDLYCALDDSKCNLAKKKVFHKGPSLDVEKPEEKAIRQGAIVMLVPLKTKILGGV
ncbi:MAG: hypothetical protein WCR04_09650 [Fibrobacteraceae bacterium]